MSATGAPAMSRTDTAVRVISASPDRVFAALTDSDALAVWLPPDGMTGRFEHFDARSGGSLPTGPGVRGRVGRTGDGLEPWTATNECGTSRAVRHWDRARARDQKPAAGSRQPAADGANVRRRASSGEAERHGGAGRFLTATLDA